MMHKIYHKAMILFLILAGTLQMHSQERRDTLVIVHRDTVWFLPERMSRACRTEGFFSNEKYLRQPFAALRTDLFAPALNAGIEIPVSNRWSVSTELWWPWVPRPVMDLGAEDGKNCIQALAVFLEGRLWLGGMHRETEAVLSRYRLLGHSLSVTAGAALYDMEWDWNGKQGELYAAGLGYSYAFPLGRRCGMYLDAGFVIGAALHVSHPYSVHSDGGYLIRRKDDSGNVVRTENRWHLGVPVKAGVSLILPLCSSKKQMMRRREGGSI